MGEGRWGEVKLWQKENKKRGEKFERQGRGWGARDGRHGFRLWLRGLAGDRGLKAAWHLTCFISTSVSFPCHSPPAMDAPTTHRNRNYTEQQKKGIMQNQRPRHRLRERTDWKVAVLPQIYPYHWCKDDPKSITSQLYVPGQGPGWALTHELQCLIHKGELIGNLKIESTLE